MRFLILLFCAALSFSPAGAQAQQPYYGQAELDALLAPIALYPDDVVQLVLDASTAPGEVAEAAKWSRVNRGMTAEDAVRAVQEYSWRPSVKAMVAYPDLIERMADSPQWTFDLGNAWVAQQAEVMNTVQALRQRAYASGTLRSDAYQTVQASDQGIAVVPAMPYIYYVPYYDPLVVYGEWSIAASGRPPLNSRTGFKLSRSAGSPKLCGSRSCRAGGSRSCSRAMSSRRSPNSAR